MKNTIIQSVKVIMLGLILSAGIAWAQTWTPPAGGPPGNNVAAPINVGAVSQVKSGALGTGPLAVFGNSAMYGDVSILGGSSNSSNNTNNQTGFLNIFALGKTALADTIVPASNLYVSGQVTIGALASSAGSHVCVDASGKLILCTVTPATPPPTPNPTPPPTPQPSGSQVFTTDGTFHVPANVTSIDVQVWGAGGGGGSSGNSNSAAGGGGGGGGGYSIGTFTVVPETYIPVTVGSGGAGGGADSEIGAGTEGEDSIFLTLSGGGGGGGACGCAGFPAAGGALGSHNASGGSAGGTANGTGNNTGNGGNGGDGRNGSGGRGGSTPGYNPLNGEAGGNTGWGGGGGGGGVDGADGRHSGGTGARGQVNINW